MATILNMDIESMVRYLDRIIREMVQSTSSSTTDVRQADASRLQAYIKAIKAKKEAIFAEPELDCPKTNRVSYEIPECPVVPPMDNDMVRDIANHLVMIREELVQAPGSVNIPNGLSVHDAMRFDTYIRKLENMVEVFISPEEPIDLPETSPLAPPTS